MLTFGVSNTKFSLKSRFVTLLFSKIKTFGDSVNAMDGNVPETNVNDSRNVFDSDVSSMTTSSGDNGGMFVGATGRTPNGYYTYWHPSTWAKGQSLYILSM